MSLTPFFLSGPPPVADVDSLTHYGEPYDGNTRFFRSTLFVAAVRACYGETCLLHGVEWMPPKVSTDHMQQRLSYIRVLVVLQYLSCGSMTGLPVI
jgi:hypothetical protein